MVTNEHPLGWVSVFWVATNLVASFWVWIDYHNQKFYRACRNIWAKKGHAIDASTKRGFVYNQSRKVRVAWAILLVLPMSYVFVRSTNVDPTITLFADPICVVLVLVSFTIAPKFLDRVFGISEKVARYTGRIAGGEADPAQDLKKAVGKAATSVARGGMDIISNSTTKTVHRVGEVVGEVRDLIKDSVGVPPAASSNPSPEAPASEVSPAPDSPEKPAIETSAAPRIPDVRSVEDILRERRERRDRKE